MDRSDVTHVMYDKKGPVVAKNFSKRGFDAYYCPTCEEALQKAIALIPQDHVISWGGSTSINEIGLRPYALENHRVIDRDTAKTPEERMEIMRQALLCDTFIMGTNAAVEDGQLFNIDGNGNRLAALAYGPKQVVVIVGMNKVMPTVESAMARARSVAAPINAQRFAGSKLPCYLTGICHHCTSADSNCAQLLRTRTCRPAGRIKIILVGENLGF
ncbi:lactate utilization protein [Megasphaera vaginalis (ex Bordigoni et al. 2020)]|uniref:lactate utilization protein n=1 Tax=Megasphaera vaginalis (ex Bordigoni et al. 2020) TaxID=2045301 RepID=UPI000C7A2DA4|nr:lactate utilization protein [Megasphaera vaginalis (ex Bordigoni et al. 2020)]